VLDGCISNVGAVSVDLVHVGSTRAYVLVAVHVIFVFLLGSSKIAAELKCIHQIFLSKERSAVGPLQRLRVDQGRPELCCLLNILIVEDSHVLIDGAADELVIAHLVMRFLICSPLPVQKCRSVSRKGRLANVFTIISGNLTYLFYRRLLNGISILVFLNSNSVSAVLLTPIELVADHDFTVGCEQIVLFN
jgi:hypothetical protein